MLTDDELLHIVTNCPAGSPRQLLLQVARAIEAKVLGGADATGVTATPSPQPVAVRYRDGSGRWRYLNYPFTKGWEFPPGLGKPEFLYERQQ